MKSIKKGLVYVLVANLVNLLFNVILNFALPHFLSIESYAVIKTYQLYISYAGLFHLGFIDGMYLKYGGKDIKELDKGNLYTNLSTLRVFQFLLVLTFLIVAVVLRAWILFFFALSILPLNMMSYFKQLYQATGEFSLYGKIINMSTIMVFAFDALLLLLKIDNGYYYLITSSAVYVFVWLFLEKKGNILIGKNDSYAAFSISEFYENIRSGILLTIGNLSSTFLTGMDRWFIKVLLDTHAFAQYSFAVSMEGFMNVAVTPLTITLYNYFCKVKEKNLIIRVRNCTMIFAALIISCAFPAALVLDIYLIKYKDATIVLFLLFAAQIFYIIIKSIYVNLYKAQKRQKEYFVKLILVIAIGFALNVICFCIFRNKESFAIGTLLSAIAWFVICILDFKYIGYKKMELIFPFVEMIAFLICGILLNPIIGLLVYLIFTVIVSKIFLGEEFDYLVNMVCDVIVLRRGTLWKK